MAKGLFCKLEFAKWGGGSCADRNENDASCNIIVC